jgi:hypothetical protein
MDETRAPRRAGTATFRERVRVVRVTMPAAKRDPPHVAESLRASRPRRREATERFALLPAAAVGSRVRILCTPSMRVTAPTNAAQADINDGNVDVGARSKALGIDDGAEEDSDD